jgi:hypothetical protein
MTDQRDKLRHPMQPVGFDGRGVIRFKQNKIVCWMLESGERGTRYDLNDLARMEFTEEDWTQFAQLIGYSVYGWGSLSYVSDRDYAKAVWHAAKCAEPREDDRG